MPPKKTAPPKENISLGPQVREGTSSPSPSSTNPPRFDGPMLIPPQENWFLESREYLRYAVKQYSNISVPLAKSCSFCSFC